MVDLSLNLAKNVHQSLLKNRFRSIVDEEDDFAKYYWENLDANEIKEANPFIESHTPLDKLDKKSKDEIFRRLGAFLKKQGFDVQGLSEAQIYEIIRGEIIEDITNSYCEIYFNYFSYDRLANNWKLVDAMLDYDIEQVERILLSMQGGRGIVQANMFKVTDRGGQIAYKGAMRTLLTLIIKEDFQMIWFNISNKVTSEFISEVRNGHIAQIDKERASRNPVTRERAKNEDWKTKHDDYVSSINRGLGLQMIAPKEMMPEMAENLRDLKRFLDALDTYMPDKENDAFSNNEYLTMKIKFPSLLQNEENAAYLHFYLYFEKSECLICRIYDEKLSFEHIEVDLKKINILVNFILYSDPGFQQLLHYFNEQNIDELVLEFDDLMIEKRLLFFQPKFWTYSSVL